jgi:hypothetical protein
MRLRALIEAQRLFGSADWVTFLLPPDTVLSLVLNSAACHTLQARHYAALQEVSTVGGITTSSREQARMDASYRRVPVTM